MTGIRRALAATRLLSVAALAAAGGLLVWSVLPLLVGLSAHIVLSGSMAPAVQPGDVVLARPAEVGLLRPGVIAVFESAIPGQLLAHRVVEVRPDGVIITRGDANSDVDSERTPLSRVHGLAVLRVPFVGLPVLWLRHGEIALLAASGVLLASACVLAVTREPMSTGALGRVS